MAQARAVVIGAGIGGLAAAAGLCAAGWAVTVCDRVNLVCHRQSPAWSIYIGLPSLPRQFFISALLGRFRSTALRAVSSPATGSPAGSRTPI